MSFWDGVGSALGKMAAQAQVLQGYKSEYEAMSDQQLWREYQDLKKRSGTECSQRRAAAKQVLLDRGIIKSEN